jgi:hypothetical protein
MVQHIDKIWQRITDNQGQSFRQKRGKEFKYKVQGATVYLSTTNHSFSKGHMEKALKYVPLVGPGQINNLHAPSYIYGILMDDRIRHELW